MKYVFCSYEISMLLKKARFNEPCIAFWDFDIKTNTPRLFPKTQDYGDECWNAMTNEESEEECRIPNSAMAPTWDEALEWIRRVHKCHLYTYLSEGSWHSIVQSLVGIPIEATFPKCDTHELAVNSSMAILLRNIIESIPKENVIVTKDNLFECAEKLGFENLFPTGIKRVEKVAILEAKLLLQTWLRDIHGIVITIGTSDIGCDIELIEMLDNNGDYASLPQLDDLEITEFRSYSEALTAALILCVQTLINNESN